MNILFLIHNPNNPNLGATRVYHILAQGLVKRGHRVDMLHLNDLLALRGRRVTLLAERFLLPYLISRGASKLDLSNYDIIMASSGMAAPLFNRLGRRTRRPVLVNHLHGLCLYDHAANLSEAQLRHWRVTWPYRLVTGPFPVRWDARGIETADVTVVQNLRDLGEVVDARPKNSSVTMIPPALHTTLLDASSVSVDAGNRDPGKLLWFATWESRKGSYYVPAAFRRIREVRPDASLTIAGTGLKEGELRAQFAPLDRDHVIVKGFLPIEEQVNLFTTSGVFLFPSISEGFGLALLEALAFGMAAVTTNTGFGADFLRDGVSARIVFPSSVHIAQAALELMTDHALRRRIGNAGREVAREFTPDRMADRYERLFLDSTLVSRP